MIKETLSKFGKVGLSPDKYPYLEVTTENNRVYKICSPLPGIGFTHFIYIVDELGRDNCVGGSRVTGPDIYAHWVTPVDYCCVGGSEGRCFDCTNIGGKHGWMNVQPDFISFADVWVIQQYEKFLEQEFDKSMDAAKKLLEGVE